MSDDCVVEKIVEMESEEAGTKLVMADDVKVGAKVSVEGVDEEPNNVDVVVGREERDDDDDDGASRLVIFDEKKCDWSFAPARASDRFLVPIRSGVLSKFSAREAAARRSTAR